MGLFRNFKLFMTGLALVVPALASAQSFNCISGNGACAQAESYLTWELTGSVFKVTNLNVANNNSFISAIYFDYAAPQTVTLLDQSAGVKFLEGSKPSNLPAGKTITFVADSSWSSDKQGANKDGVDAGQWISFTMAQTALTNFSNGSMRVGVHLQGLDGGKSESLTTVVTAVPEPETYAMMLAGLGLMGTVARRRKVKGA